MYKTTILFTTPEEETFEINKTIPFIPAIGTTLSFNDALQTVEVRSTDFDFETNTLWIFIVEGNYTKSDFEGL